MDALREVSLSIERGERLALMGASGSGKSSLLRVLAGLERPTRGRMLRDGADITRLEPPDRGVGMVLQDAPLYGHLTLRDNVAQPLRVQGASAADARCAAEKMLERVGLSSRAVARGSDISGGERRRAALARALVTKPSLLLLDEPFASLDASLRLSLRDEVRSLCRDFDCACVHATHDGLEALALGTTLAVLDRGRLVDLGAPERVWSSPACAASARLIGAVPMNIIEVPEPGGANRSFGVRPEHLSVVATVHDGAAMHSGPIDGAPTNSRNGIAAWSACGVIECVDPMDGRALLAVRLGNGSMLRAIVESVAAPGDCSRSWITNRDAALSAGCAVIVAAPREAMIEFPPEKEPNA